MPYEKTKPVATREDLEKFFDSAWQKETEPAKTEEQNGEPWAAYLPKDNRSERQLALDILSRELGGDRRQAAETLALSPDTIQSDGMQKAIAAEREVFKSANEHRAKLAYEASPEGRLAEGQRLLAEQEENEKKLAAADAILKNAGNFDPTDTPEQRLALSGIERESSTVYQEGLAFDPTDPDSTSLEANRKAAEAGDANTPKSLAERNAERTANE